MLHLNVHGTCGIVLHQIMADQKFEQSQSEFVETITQITMKIYWVSLSHFKFQNSVFANAIHTVHPLAVDGCRTEIVKKKNAIKFKTWANEVVQLYCRSWFYVCNLCRDNSYCFSFTNFNINKCDVLQCWLPHEFS